MGKKSHWRRGAVQSPGSPGNMQLVSLLYGIISLYSIDIATVIVSFLAVHDWNIIELNSF